MEPNLRVRYSSRNKVQNPSPDAPRWTAYVTVFGAYDTTGTGATRRQAYESAIDELPPHVRRHFVFTGL